MFSPTTYYRMIEAYNNEISYGVLLPTLAFIIALVWRDFRGQDWPLLSILGSMFLWVAWQFFIVRFQEIMWAAAYLGSAFFAQGLALLWLSQINATGSVKSQENEGSRWLNYSPLFLLLFPVLGIWGVGGLEIAGMTPDPTVYLTVAVLCLTRQPVWLYIVPMCWLCFSWLLLIAMDQQHAWLPPVLLVVMLCFFMIANRRPRVEKGT